METNKKLESNYVAVVVNSVLEPELVLSFGPQEYQVTVVKFGDLKKGKGHLLIGVYVIPNLDFEIHLRMARKISEIILEHGNGRVVSMGGDFNVGRFAFFGDKVQAASNVASTKGTINLLPALSIKLLANYFRMKSYLPNDVSRSGKSVDLFFSTNLNIRARMPDEKLDVGDTEAHIHWTHVLEFRPIVSIIFYYMIFIVY